LVDQSAVQSLKCEELPDLTISKSSETDNNLITYTIEVENQSPTGTFPRSVSVVDNLPAGFTVLTLSANCGFLSPLEIECDLGPIEGETTETVRISGFVTDGDCPDSAKVKVTLINVATVDPAEEISEANEDNNSSVDNLMVDVCRKDRIPIPNPPPIFDRPPNTVPPSDRPPFPIPRPLPR
jgi:uncharacterized repeat protein (TIGR01451 family)